MSYHGYPPNNSTRENRERDIVMTEGKRPIAGAQWFYIQRRCLSRRITGQEKCIYAYYPVVWCRPVVTSNTRQMWISSKSRTHLERQGALRIIECRREPYDEETIIEFCRIGKNLMNVEAMTMRVKLSLEHFLYSTDRSFFCSSPCHLFVCCWDTSPENMCYFCYIR